VVRDVTEARMNYEMLNLYSRALECTSNGVVISDMGLPGQLLRDAVARGEPATVVMRNYRKDSTLFFNELAIAPVANPDGSVRHYVGVLNDVSERERPRMALAERSARLNAVFDLSPDGYVVFDREGVLLYCNRAFNNMTGWSGEALGGGVTLEQFDRHMRAMCDPTRPYPPIAHLNDGVHDSFDTEDLLELVNPRRAVLTRLAR
jgi:PAS domain-containing protein